MPKKLNFLPRPILDALRWCCTVVGLCQVMMYATGRIRRRAPQNTFSSDSLALILETPHRLQTPSSKQSSVLIPPVTLGLGEW